MLLPYKVDVPMERMPWANWALIAVTSLISVVVMVRMVSEGHAFQPKIPPQLREQLKTSTPEQAKQMLRDLGLDNLEEYSFPGALDPHNFALSQLITYQFVHGDLIHLIGNMFFLFCFGNAVNAKLGHAGFLASYVFLGVIGGLGWLWLGNGLPLVGASGSIMGIIGIFVVLFPRNDVTVLYGMMGSGGSFELPAFVLVLLYMGADLIGLMKADQGIAYVTHLAGSLCGAGLAIALIKAGKLQPTDYEQNLLQVLGLMPGREERASPTTRKKKKRRIVQQLPPSD